MQVKVAPVPALAKPLLHVQVVDPDALVLPAGQAVQDEEPALAAYVLVPQTGWETGASITMFAAACAMVNGRTGWKTDVGRGRRHVLEHDSDTPEPLVL